MYDIIFFFLSISVLKTWQQKQDSTALPCSLRVSIEWRYLLSSAATVYLVSEELWDFGKGWERVDWEGKGGVSCRIIYNIYSLHGGRFERCRFVALSLVIFIMVSVSTNIFLCFFCDCLLCLFGGGPCCISTQCLQSAHLSFSRRVLI